jgi:hypothetical protein
MVPACMAKAYFFIRVACSSKKPGAVTENAPGGEKKLSMTYSLLALAMAVSPMPSNVSILRDSSPVTVTPPSTWKPSPARPCLIMPLFNKTSLSRSACTT